VKKIDEQTIRLEAGIRATKQRNKLAEGLRDSFMPEFLAYFPATKPKLLYPFA
jgi:hypothetical protein